MNSDAQRLLDALQSPKFYGHKTTKIELIETHISWIVLTGKYAYKIKKPVSMGFLDFSTLENRKRYCELELVLNKRLSPDYYLEVLPITEGTNCPTLNGKGEAIEYVLKMRQFPQKNQLDRALNAGNLDAHAMDILAEKIADFHRKIEIAGVSQRFGDLEHVHHPVSNCYSDILERISKKEDIQRVELLQRWSNQEFERLGKVFEERKVDGFIRECHGDLHLRNIAIVNDEVVAFDCIEFNADLRWNDVISEIAFLVMDLDDHQQPGLASRFLNRYLELSGDYLGLKVFRYYLVYRAIVRAMVSCIRFSQEDVTESEKKSEYIAFQKYIELAENYIEPTKPRLFITHGLSGSGKTTVSQALLQAYPSIRIRSDIERKRLWGVQERQRKNIDVHKGIYSSDSSVQTYQILLDLSEQLLKAGFSVIVDATFLKQKQRNLFRKLAELENIEFTIMHCIASLSVMKNRVEQRSKEDRDASDADLAVLEHQIDHNDEFSEQEKIVVINIDTEIEITDITLREKLLKVE